MPAELLQYIQGRNLQKNARFQVVYQCAPVLKKVKASNIISLPMGAWDMMAGEYSSEKVQQRVLARGRQKEVVFLYRREWLENILFQEENRRFMVGLGYKRMDVDYVTERLSFRYQAYANLGAAFPHEIGVLLQYPLEDVCSFVEQEGQGYLLSGYWKVYHRPEYAREIFKLYDRVREEAVMEYVKGYTLNQIII